MSEINRFETREQPEPETIEVSQGDGWKITKAPNVIETTGLGPCVGVIVYSPESKEAMVGHFIDPRVDNLSGMLDEAIKRYPDTTKLKVYVGGQAPDTDDAPHFTEDKAVRAFVKQQLESHGFQNSQITTRYQNSNDSTILRIDTSTGSVDYDEESEWGDEDDY
jgi:hypothetical protein